MYFLVIFASLLGAAVSKAQYTVVDSGSSATFSGDAGASSYSWTLDGASVGANSSTYTYSPANDAVGTHVLAVSDTVGGVQSSHQWGVRVRIPIPASTLAYYVATTGSDTNPGTIAQPFRTLAGAQNAIRQLSRPLPAGGVTVYLRGGTYVQASSFTLSGSDSGSPNAPVIYSNYPGETAVVTGGKSILSSQFVPLASSQISRLAPGVSAGQVWELDLASAGVVHKGPFAQSFGAGNNGVVDVFYNGTRMPISRYPNNDLMDESQTPNLSMDGVAADITGTAYLNGAGIYQTSGSTALNVSGTVSVGGAYHYYPADDAHVRKWASALTHGGLWVQGYWRVVWQVNAAQVQDLDFGSQTVELTHGGAVPGGIGSKFKRPKGSYAEPYWVINLLEEMDQPGEWAIDFSRNKLYYLMPTSGTAPADNSIVLADLSSPLISITGSNILVQGLTINYSLGQGVVITGGSNDLVLNCAFSNLDGDAVDINNNTAGSCNGVLDCTMSNLGQAGVTTLGGTNSAVNVHDYVVNNQISNYGQIVTVYEPAVGAGSGCRVAHNITSGSPQAGTQWSGYNQIWEYNDISQYCRFSNDFGSMYGGEDNVVTNSVIRYNYTHDSPLGDGYYADNSFTPMTVYGNVFNLHPNAGSSGDGVLTKVSAPFNGVVPQVLNLYNNISVNCLTGFVLVTATGGKVESNVSYNNHLSYMWTEILENTGGDTTTSSSASILASGTNGDYGADPGFINFAGDDLRLKPDSRIFTDIPKFRNIPMEMIGLYGDEYRTVSSRYSPYVVAPSGVYLGGTAAVISGTLVYPMFDYDTTVSVYYGPADGGTNAGAWANVSVLGTLSSGSFSALVSGLPNNAAYYARVLAVNSAGQSWSSSTVALLPPAPGTPTGLTAYPFDAEVDLYWNAPANAASYNVKRGTTSGGPYTTVASNVPSPSFADTSIADGTAYYYVVTAANASGESSPSNEAAAEPLKGDGVDAWTSMDIGNVAYTGSSSYNNGTYTVAGSGADIWGSSDAFQYLYQSLSGDGCIVARVPTEQNTSAYAKAGVMMRNTLTANSAEAMMLVNISQSGFQYRLTSGSNTGQTIVGGTNKWVKVARLGNSFTGYTSADGVTWTQVGVTQSINMNSTIYVGLAVSAHNNTALNTSTFDSVNILPASSWYAGDIGSPQIAGFTTYSGSVMTIDAAGADVSGTSDQFRFAYISASGDCDITARVTAVENTNVLAKTGVMIRGSLDPASPQVFACVTPGSTEGVAFLCRTGTGGSTSTSNVAGLSAPYWVRLTRVGNAFTAYSSPDGSVWTNIGSQTFSTSANVYIGIAATSHNSSLLGAGTVDHITIDP